MAGPDAESLGLRLMPEAEEVVTAEEELAAAVESALAPDYPAVPGSPPEPLGRTWRFDWARGRFVSRGASPAETEGQGAVEEWCMMALSSARGAHPVFGPDFGMEDPEGLIGGIPSSAAMTSLEERMRTALLQHDRVTAVEEFEADYDPASGVVTIRRFVVVLDEDDTLEVIPEVRT